MKAYYTEIVTSDVEQTCKQYQASFDCAFDGPVAELGNAFVYNHDDGTMVGIRGALNDMEVPTIRPYWLVDNIQRAMDKAIESGAEVAHPPMEIPGYGWFAIYVLGGNQHALWQN